MYLKICLDCDFYAILDPTQQVGPEGILLSPLGCGENCEMEQKYQSGNNTEPLGTTSSYLKIVGASCNGCCELGAPSCTLPGTFVPS